jgi:Domain of unknown function (DUF4136)
MRPNQIVSTLFATASLLVFAACSSVDINTAKSPNVDFNQYKTYSWISTPAQNSIAPEGSILEQTIKATADQQLMSKGLSQAGSSAPDLFVSYSARTRNSVEYRSDGPSTWDWGWSDMTTAYPVREGSITLKFTDARTGKPVWQGTASNVIGSAGPTQDDVASAVTKMIQKYPSA